MSNLKVDQITSDKWVNKDGSENFKCRAWAAIDCVSFTIKASGNVSSITDTSTGHCTVNFATPMPVENYSIIALARVMATLTIPFLPKDGVKTKNACTIRVSNTGGTNLNSDYLCVQVVC